VTSHDIISPIRYLLASFKRRVQDLMLADLQHQRLIKILQSMPYLFRFMVQSSHLHQKHFKRVELAFIQEFSEVFTSFNRLMAIPEPQLKGVHVVQVGGACCYGNFTRKRWFPGNRK
jgi:hypothetical protein